jgi:hypothetical protein
LLCRPRGGGKPELKREIIRAKKFSLSSHFINKVTHNQTNPRYRCNPLTQ